MLLKIFNDLQNFELFPKPLDFETLDLKKTPTFPAQSNKLIVAGGKPKAVKQNSENTIDVGNTCIFRGVINIVHRLNLGY